MCLFSMRSVSAFTVACPDSQEKAGVLVHDNSIEVYHKLLSAIDSAEYYFEFCPCMAGGDILQEVIAHLDARMSVVPTLRSYMLIQPTFIDEQDKRILADMRERWSDRFSYLFTDCVPGGSILSPNVIEMHVKCSIVDGKYIFMGGTNFEDFMCTRGDHIPEYSDSSRKTIGGMQRPSAFRDQDVTLRSESLGLALRREFHAHYALWDALAQGKWFDKNLDHFRSMPFPELTQQQASASYCAEIEEDPEMIAVPVKDIRVLISGPDEERNTITQMYAQLIAEAEHSIRIAHMYFIPQEEVMQKLHAACFDRGVRTEVITNGCTEYSPNFTTVYAWGNRMNYFFLSYGERPSLWNKKVFMTREPNPSFSVSEYFVPDTQLHKKCMIVDDRIFVIGSYNFGKKSDLFDYESIMVIDSPEVAKRANAVFNKDLSLSKPVSHQDIYDWYFHPIHHVIGHLQINFMPG